MTFTDAALIVIWPHTLIAGALIAGARWFLTRRRRPPQLQLTQAQVDRVIANYERELQEDRT